MHDQTTTAPANNYRRSINTQMIIYADQRRFITAGHCRPGNRNDIVVASRTMAHLLDGTRLILGDGVAAH